MRRSWPHCARLSLICCDRAISAVPRGWDGPGAAPEKPALAGRLDTNGLVGSARYFLSPPKRTVISAQYERPNAL